MADYWEFPGGPVVGLSAFTAKGPGSILQDVGKKKKKKKGTLPNSKAVLCLQHIIIIY